MTIIWLVCSMMGLWGPRKNKEETGTKDRGEELTEEIEENEMGLMRTHQKQVTKKKNIEEKTRILVSDTGKQGNWTEGEE